MGKARKVPARVMRAIQDAGVQVPQVAELVSHFVAAAGGPRAMAKMMMQEYLHAKPGSIIRQRLLDSVLRLMNFANQQIQTVDEIDLLSEDDLKVQLEELVGEIDATQEQEADAAGGAGADPEPPAWLARPDREA